jgi:integral membrane protein
VSIDPQAVRKALGYYKVLAIVAGVALFILILEMVLKYGMGQDNVLTRNWSYIHGFIYMAYAASIANLGFKAAWPFVRIVANLLTGFVPFLPFIAERRVSADVERQLAAVGS